MRNKAISIILTLIIAVGIIPATSITASADDEVVEVTVFGTRNYDGANEIVEKTNEARAAEGLDALVMDVQLTEWAMQRAAEIAFYYAHIRPDGTARTTVTNDFYFTNYVSGGENCVIGTYGSDGAVEAWMNSPGHRAQILESDYDAIGVGYVTIGTYSYFVQWFAAYEDANERGSYSYVAVQSTCSGTKTTTFTISTYTSNLGDFKITSRAGNVIRAAVGENAVVYLKGYAGGEGVAPATLATFAPITSNVKDESTGEVIATTSVASDGAVTITPTSAGKGYLYLYAYEGASPQSMEIIVSSGYTVTFDSDGGSSVSSQTVAYNSTATEPTTPTRSGYTFAGWYTETEGGTKYDFDTAVTKDLTLYAHWTANTTASGGTETTKTVETTTAAPETTETAETTAKLEETTETAETATKCEETTKDSETSLKPDEETTVSEETTGVPDEGETTEPEETTDEVTDGVIEGTETETGAETAETVTDEIETTANTSDDNTSNGVASDLDNAVVANNGDNNGNSSSEEENGSNVWIVVLVVVLLIAVAGVTVFVVLKRNKSVGEAASVEKNARTDESAEAENDNVESDNNADGSAGGDDE